MESNEPSNSDQTTEETPKIDLPDRECAPEDIEKEANSAEDVKDVDASSEYSNISMQEDEAQQPPLDVSEKNLAQDVSPKPKLKNKCNMTKTEEELQDLCSNMFKKMEEYMKGEVAGSVDDYTLLERMNKSTTYKYQNMLQIAKAVGQKMHEINHKFSDLRPYLEQIENIEESVLALEQAAYKLDGYAKRLEERFKKLEKR